MLVVVVEVQRGFEINANIVVLTCAPNVQQTLAVSHVASKRHTNCVCLCLVQPLTELRTH